jgi:Leucine-rich repeat (LRR) protein
LEYLYLDNNNLTGEIPKEIGNLTNLIGLYLFNNKLTGVIPEEIKNLTDLDFLYLDYNCDLYTDDISVQQFIDNVQNGSSYQEIIDTNRHDCAPISPIVTYLLF